MDAVRDTAAAPAPLPFPWGRFLTGLVAAAVSLVSAGLLVMGPAAAAIGAASEPLSSIASAVGGSLAVTVACLAMLRIRLFFADRDA